MFYILEIRHFLNFDKKLDSRTPEGARLLNAIQDVYLNEDVTVA